MKLSSAFLAHQAIKMEESELRQFDGASLHLTPIVAGSYRPMLNE